MITVAFPNGEVEEYDLNDQDDTRTYDYKIYNRVRILKKGEIIVIKGGGE